MSDRYVLDEHGEPKVEPDLMTWSKWFATDERRVVRKNSFYVDGEEVTVSTVFLGLDHNWSDGPAVLWETMIFGDGREDNQWRYTSRDEAIANHERLVAELLGSDHARRFVPAGKSPRRPLL